MANRIPELIEQFKELEKAEIIAGVPHDNEFLQMISRVNEFGMTIYPKNYEYLSVPNGKGGVVKLKSVTIPSRPFIRYTFEQKQEQWGSYTVEQLSKLIRGNIKSKTLLNRVGKRMQTDIQKTITHFKSPKNAPLTIANKGFDNPLEHTGKLKKSITYRVERSSD